MAVRRGEVYFIDLDPTVGREQGGRRPVVVVSSDTLNNMPLVHPVVPGTRQSKVRTIYPWHVLVPPAESGLPEPTVFLTFQVRAVDFQRFRESPRGSLGPTMMDRIEKALLHALDIRLGRPSL